VSVNPGEVTSQEARLLMDERDVRHVPVVDAARKKRGMRA
jgi:hypothetical protein